MKLLQNVTSTVNQVCKRLKQDGGGGEGGGGGSWRRRIKPGRLNPNSVHAVKNTRKKMEDRHVVIHDLNTIYSSEEKVSPHLNAKFHFLCMLQLWQGK